jgi:hypothetical protein
MKVTEIRKLSNGQYEIDTEVTLWVTGQPRKITATTIYRSNLPSGDGGYTWTRLPDLILVKESEPQDQLNAWLYDWLQQQKNTE